MLSKNAADVISDINFQNNSSVKNNHLADIAEALEFRLKTDATYKYILDEIFTNGKKIGCLQVLQLLPRYGISEEICEKIESDLLSTHSI